MHREMERYPVGGSGQWNRPICRGSHGLPGRPDRRRLVFGGRRAEVESVLAGHPAVVESAILAKPCPVLGERVHAVIVIRDSEVSEDALRAWCAERLSDYKVPETMVLTAEPLPRNANGKVMKRQLREAWAAALS